MIRYLRSVVCDKVEDDLGAVRGILLFIARDSSFCLAVKAGDNDDNHNHNDTGSLTLYKNGKPVR